MKLASDNYDQRTGKLTLTRGRYKYAGAVGRWVGDQRPVVDLLLSGPLNAAEVRELRAWLDRWLKNNG